MSQLYDATYLGKLLQTVSANAYEYLRNESLENVVFVGIVTNGVFFAKRIQSKLQALDMNISNPVMELDISLYRDDFAKQKEYMSVGQSAMSANFDGKHVVLFDDVISTGRTARAALNAIFDYGRPDKVSCIVLFDRDARQVPIHPNVIGQRLQVDPNLRVNVEFLEVVGEDGVILKAFSS